MKDNNRIIFKNQPKLTSDQADTEFDQMRMSLLPHIKELVLAHDLFKRKEVSVTFSHQGISSVVAMLETVDNKIVLKVPLNTRHHLGDVLVLEKWKEVGVSVPHIFEEGLIGEHRYFLMDYIDSPIVLDTYSEVELVDQKKYVEIGSILSQMHKAYAQGYGRIVNGQAEHETFKDWVLSRDIQKRIEYVHKHKLLGAEHGDILQAVEILTEHTALHSSSYCHEDYGISNMFATDPITIFDPNPNINNGYVDLGRTIILMVARGSLDESIDQLVEGYFGEDGYDEQVLQSAILLNAYRKFLYWNKKGNSKRINAVQEYLKEKKYE